LLLAVKAEKALKAFWRCTRAIAGNRLWSSWWNASKTWSHSPELGRSIEVEEQR